MKLIYIEDLRKNEITRRSLRQVKVFDQRLDVLYQNLFSGAITLILQKIKLVQSGTKFVPPKLLF